jgi:hypothetical protein
MAAAATAAGTTTAAGTGRGVVAGLTAASRLEGERRHLFGQIYALTMRTGWFVLAQHQGFKFPAAGIADKIE